MKKIIIVVAVLILLQLVLVSASHAAPPACGPVNYGYNHGYCGHQPYYGQRYHTNRPYYQHHTYYYQGYYPCCGYQTYSRPYTYYGAQYGYNYNCYHGSCYRH